MPKRVYRSEAARDDLIEQAVYLSVQAGQALADRFLRNAGETFELLAAQPGLGALLRLKDERLAGIRKWAISDFENHLIFYLPQPDGVLIVRVLHRASDWWTLLGIDA